MGVVKLKAAARWLAPSAVAACAGAIAAGAVEGAGMDDAFGGIAAAGFLAILALPMLFVASAIARGLWAAWRPHELGLVEDHGGAPRLAGWIVFSLLAAFGLGWSLFQGTWVLAQWTAFKPIAVSFLMPVFGLVAATVLAIASRPTVALVAAGVRRVDARWRRAGRTSLVTPWRIAIATAIVVYTVTYLVWHFVIARRVGPLDLSPLVAPALGAAAAACVHLLSPRLPARTRVPVAGILVALAALSLACAVFAWRERPSLTLAIWGERPLSGLAVDQLFDLDTIHDRIPVAEMKPAEHPGSPHPDIILVTIDTVRADHTPPYNGSAEMPVLRDLGLHGTVFEWAFSPSNVTRRSIPSIILGIAPNRVHGRVVSWALRVDPRHVTLAERLAAGGYETAGFMCCDGIWGKEVKTGLQRGLQHLEIEPHESGTALARMARAWLDQRERTGPHAPLFLWMHVIEPHNWQSLTGEPHTDEDRRRFYDRSLQLSDTFLVQLLGAFSNRPTDRAPIVIVTADHGEGLGDHGQPYHSTDLYDSQIRVPLVMAGPGIKRQVVPETVSLTDLAPTILQLAGFDPPAAPAFDGHSFADLATGARAPDPEAGIAFATMIKDRSSPGGLATVIKGRYKLIDNGSSAEMYDVHVDPDERSNLITVKPAIAEMLKTLLRQFESRGEQSPFE